MIADLDNFKFDRAEAIKSRDLEKIKAFMEKYGIITFLTNSEILESLDQMPSWD